MHKVHSFKLKLCNKKTVLSFQVNFHKSFLFFEQFYAILENFAKA